MVAAARSRHIRFNFIIQNFAQLTKVYGKEDAETIKGNCNILYLISSELQALEELSKMCGEVKSKEKEKTSSTPLVTVSDLQRMSMGEVIWLRLRMMPFKTKLAYDWQMNNNGTWGHNYGKAGYPEREKKEVQLFDIREFVKAQKKAKMEEMMANSEVNPMSGGLPGMGGSSPFGGASPFGGTSLFGGSNPFGTSSNPLGGSSFSKGGSPFGGELNSLLGNKPSNNPTPDTINVDELVKKIDAKIAELEEEEKREQEEAENKKKQENIIDAEVSEEKIVKDSSMYEDGTNSDAFFDDFFSDD